MATSVPAALSAVAAVWAGRAAGRSRGAAKLAWRFLAAGAAVSAAARLLVAAPLDGAAASIATLLSLYLAAALRPHAWGVRARRPAALFDPLLIGLLFVGLHGYFLLSRLPELSRAGTRALALAPVLALALLVLFSLRVCSRQARVPEWNRVYGLLAGTAAVAAAGVAIRIWKMEPHAAGALAGALEALLLACAAAAAPAPITAGEVEPAALSAWRDLVVPVVVLAGLLVFPLLDHLLTNSSFRGGVDPWLPWGALTTVLGLYVTVLLARQFAVQMQNRSLALDLQQESARLRLLVENIHDAVVSEDLEGRLVFANDRFLEMFGFCREEVSRLRLDDCLHPEDRPLHRETRIGQLLAASGPVRFEFRGRRRDGAVLYLESSTVPVAERGLVRAFQSVIRDITERRQAEERQRELAQRLEVFVDHMPLGCIVFDLERRILEWNGSATRIFGWTEREARGRPGLELLVPPELWPEIAAVLDELLETQSSNQRVNQNLTKDGRRIECEWLNTSLVDQTGRVVAIASMIQDVTDKKNLEAQLRQSQKMEAVGVLAGGVAHDFNNLLTIINGNLALAEMLLAPGHPAAQGLADARRAGDRAAELVRQLLSFGRKSRAQRRPLQLSECLGDLALLRRAMDPRIVMEIHHAPELWPVEADEGQIRQVVMNLCVNARDAMPEGGRLTVQTANRVIDEAYGRCHPQSRPGEFVRLSVSDSGVGMDEATRSRVFEPFFTTKAVGKGTGLGLAMVYGIVQQHGGWITVESEPGRGAVFSIFLPRSKAAEAPPAAAPVPAAGGGTETILLVDDEEMILRLARAILEGSGHRVLQAHDGEEALEVFEQHRAEVDLVLLDMVMPRKSGRDTLAELHRRAPEVPVVLASGYTAVGAEELAALGARAYIQKPYQPAELARTVRLVLGALRPAAD